MTGNPKKSRSKPARTPLFPWKAGSPAPGDIPHGDMPREVLHMLPEVIVALAKETLGAAGLSTNVADYENSAVLEEIERRCRGWENPHSGTWSSPPLWEAAQAMRHAHGVRTHAEAGDLWAAAWCAHIATTHVWRLSAMSLEKQHQAGVGSLVGGLKGGLAKRIPGFAERLAKVDSERPGRTDADKARLLQRRGDSRKLGAIKAHISRLRKEAVTTGAM